MAFRFVAAVIDRAGNVMRSLGLELIGDLPAPVRAFWELPVGEERGALTLEPAPVFPVAWPADLPVQPLPVSNTSVRVTGSGNQLWIGDSAHGLYADFSLGRIWWTGEPTQAAWLLALAEAQRRTGWLPLHAASVFSGGRAAAFAGVSGAGKSTAALRLLAAGYTLLSEDQLWWHPEQNLAVGLDSYLRVYQRSLDLFTPDLQPSGPQDAYGKWCLPLIRGQSAPLHRFILLGDAPLSALETVRQVWSLTGVPLTPLGRQQAAAGVQALLNRNIKTVARDDILTYVSAALAADGAGSDAGG